MRISYAHTASSLSESLIRATPNISTAASGSQPDTPSSGIRHTPSDDGERPYSTALDPGSPTDEDEPPSPTTSSRSAQRRVEASQRFLGSTKKRPSDSSDSSYLRSPKLTKISKGQQPSEATIPQPLFKKPSLSSFRSHQAERSFGAVPSQYADMNNSFQTTTVNSSFSNTLASSQETQPDTAQTSTRTSFSSEYKTAIEPEGLNFRKRTSSTTIGSLDDEDMLAVNDAIEAQLRREMARSDEPLSSQERIPRSSSTYGSVDEEDLLETSFAYDDSNAVPPSTSWEQKHLPSGTTKVSFPQSPSAEESPFNRPLRRDVPAAEADACVRYPALPQYHDSEPYSCGITLAESPSRKTQNLPAPIVKESPSKMPYYIRDIPEQHLFTEPFQKEWEGIPYSSLFVCSWLAHENGLSLSKMLECVDTSDALSNPSEFLRQVWSKLDSSDATSNSLQEYCSARRKNFEGYTFKVRVEFNRPRLSKSDLGSDMI